MLLADVLVRKGQAAEGAREAERAVAIAPEDAAGRLALARARTEQKRYVDAAAEIARAAKADGESARVLLTRARLARARGSSSEALELLARAVQADPALDEAFPLQGAWLLEAKRASEAAVAFEKATIVDPTDAPELARPGRDLPGREARSRRRRLHREGGGGGPGRRGGPLPARGGDGAGGSIRAGGRGRAPGQGPGPPAADTLLQSLAARGR